MTELLVRTFVKNHKQIEKLEVRTSYGILTSLVGIVCNLLLFAVKIAVGIILNSISVMADAFNNLSDAASSIISFIGVKMASKPADRDHPFGHGRIEYISALVVAFIILEVGFTFLKTSVNKIRNPEDMSFQLISVIILLLSIIVKLWLGIFNRKLGNRIQSTVMKATSTDAFGDALITTFTIISILVAHFTGLNIDGWVGTLVALLVMWAGIGIAKETLMPLIGEAVDPILYKEITDKVESYDGIVGSHDLIVHNYGPTKSMASVHAEVPNDVDIEISHEIIDQIERDVAREMGIFLVIHMDPIETKNDEVNLLKHMVETNVYDIDKSLSIHDFRFVDGEEHVNLIFDVVVPHHYTEKQMEEVKELISERLEEEDDRYRCVITVEKSFVAEEKK